MAPTSPQAPAFDPATYEVLRQRLSAAAGQLDAKLAALGAERRRVFGALPTALTGAERISTAHACVPRDMVAVGDTLLVGFRAQFGLKNQIEPEDLFGAYDFDPAAAEGERFRPRPLAGLLDDPAFRKDFADLFKFYKGARFAKFFRIGQDIHVKFHVGRPQDIDDFKSFKFTVDGPRLAYQGNRADHEVRFPRQREIDWQRATREMQRAGDHPHVSIEDEVFVECVGGDLTIKVEDNTKSGKGVYAEPVEDKDQRLDDAEIEFVRHGPLILLRMRPYKEKAHRHFVFNCKTREVRRCDALAATCVPLPEDHGVIFPGGLSLASGRHQEFAQVFEGGMAPLFEFKQAAPNGEDFLYAFYDRPSGTYSLFLYNLVAREIQPPIVCHGQAQLDDGTLLVLKGHDEPQKTHNIQVWRTPMLGPGAVPPQADTSAYLYKLGARDVARGLADAAAVLELARRPEPYEALYVDLADSAREALDAHAWLARAEAQDAASALRAIHEAAQAAIGEFEKVRAGQRAAAEKTAAVEAQCQAAVESALTRPCAAMEDFVRLLVDLRAARAEAIALREVRYADPAKAAALEAQVAEAGDRLGAKAAEFLAKDEALAPYAAQVQRLAEAAGTLPSVLETRKAEAEAAGAAAGLEALVETISNLKIEDAARRTTLTDKVSAVFAGLNAARSRLKARRESLAQSEGQAEFNARLRLLEQAVSSRLDLCDTPEACETHAAKVMVEVESLEGRFAEFEAFAPLLADKRTEVAAAFEGRRVFLLEKRTKRAEALVQAAERLFKGLQGRLEALADPKEVHAFLAADPMAEKARALAAELEGLGDRVRADALHTRLKALREESLRRLTDKKEMQEGEGLIRLGRHLFSVNGQKPELTTAVREGKVCLHITGTRFFEPVRGAAAAEVEACRGGCPEVFERDSAAESPAVYRGEYLAHLAFGAADAAEPDADRIRRLMNERLADGYVKGVHDADAGKILAALRAMDANLGALRFGPAARTLARLHWLTDFGAGKELLAARVRGAGAAQGLFAGLSGAREALAALTAQLAAAAQKSDGAFDPAVAPEAAACLFAALAAGGAAPEAVSAEGDQLHEAFFNRLAEERAEPAFRAALAALAEAPWPRYQLALDWARGFLAGRAESERDLLPELALLLWEGARPAATRVVQARASVMLEGMQGSHPRIADGGRMELSFHRFHERLERHRRADAPAFERFAAARSALVEGARGRLRVGDLVPKTLSSFVRNQLVNEVFLPLIGDNLAKQIGAAGAQGRTDRMGLLLLISPPGYGKTTLVEYLSARLGLAYVKINGPALGHGVTSLDPAAAPDAASRQEVERLNAAFEMGDNVLLILDDIQHLNPEFLQKFISLCDGTRRIEGVWQGEPKTYDLRGRKFAVCMAGNPYTESGEKFRIPDMLANRADTYNLGDMVSAHPTAFRRSYLENALTSNPGLAMLAGRPQGDVQKLIGAAEQVAENGGSSGSRGPLELESALTPREAEDALAVLVRLCQARDVVMRMNAEYIKSAGTDNAHRTEPPFLLQGSYRNMNRIAARVSGVMNEAELRKLIVGNYEQEAQTLTGGTEANLLKFKELMGLLTGKDAARWEELKASFRRTNAAKSLGGDAGAAAVAQLAALNEGLVGLGRTLGERLGERPAPAADAAPWQAALDRVEAPLRAIEAALREGGAPAGGAGKKARGKAEAAAEAPGAPAPQEIRITNKIPDTFLFILKEQFKLMQAWMEPITRTNADQDGRLDAVAGKLADLTQRYEEVIARLDKQQTE